MKTALDYSKDLITLMGGTVSKNVSDAAKEVGAKILLPIIEQAMKQARDSALEEAATICDTTTGQRYAEQIRALKGK